MLYSPLFLAVEVVAVLEIVGALRIFGAVRSVPTRLPPAKLRAVDCSVFLAASVDASDTAGLPPAIGAPPPLALPVLLCPDPSDVAGVIAFCDFER